MKTQEKKPEAVSHTLQAKSGKTHQPPATAVLQAYKEGVIQREADEEEEPLQMKSQQSPANAAVLQAYKEGVVQREANEEEEPLQMKNNQTGLPDNLKSGVEALSGYSMDDVRVHFNSSQPAQFQALAYTQGTNIHVAPGQEQHLAHEAWHVVQQKQGRVQPTMQMKGINVNDDEGLEREADEMGSEASILGTLGVSTFSQPPKIKESSNFNNIITQCRIIPAGIANKNYNDFRLAESYRAIYTKDYGYFLANYNPKARLLKITLPVFFQFSHLGSKTLDGRSNDEINSEMQKNIFKYSIQSNWSDKFPITTTAMGSANNPSPWSGLNPVRVSVEVEERDNPANAFTATNDEQEAASKVTSEGVVNISKGAFYETLHQVTDNDSIKGHATLFNRNFPVVAHEAGHMIGLDDEYRITNFYNLRFLNEVDNSIYTPVLNEYFQYEEQWYYYSSVTFVDENDQEYTQFHENQLSTIRLNSKYEPTYALYHFNMSNRMLTKMNAVPWKALTRHFELTRDIKGIEYAKANARMSDAVPIASSIMHSGSTVKSHHYVTFLEALVCTIRNSAFIGNKTNMPNQLADWTIG